MRSPIRELIRLRALEMLASGPIKKEILLSQLGSDFIAATKEDYHWVINDMIIYKQAIELEYIIDDKDKKSIIFPINCDLFIKFASGIHSFVREIV